jgi:hypothetical protein
MQIGYQEILLQLLANGLLEHHQVSDTTGASMQEEYQGSVAILPSNLQVDLIVTNIKHYLITYWLIAGAPRIQQREPEDPCVQHSPLHHCLSPITRERQLLPQPK